MDGEQNGLVVGLDLLVHLPERLLAVLMECTDSVPDDSVVRGMLVILTEETSGSSSRDVDVRRVRIPLDTQAASSLQRRSLETSSPCSPRLSSTWSMVITMLVSSSWS